MPLPNYQLFLGFPVDEAFLESLDQIDEKLQNYFVQQNDHYLQKIVGANGTVYFGKFVGEKTDLQELHAVEANIYSLLKRLAPGFPFQKTALRLFPAEGNKT